MKKAINEPHDIESIKKRLNKVTAHNYLGDSVLGAIDGCVTTFAIIAGTMGGGFSSIVALTLGLSNLIADGFSMALSNYQSAKSFKDKVLKTYEIEMLEVETIPQGEREEIRQIYRKKGFEGPLLEQVVDVITRNKERWVETMVQEEHGLPIIPTSPVKVATVTFIAFLSAGVCPVLPFFFGYSSQNQPFIISFIVTGLVFLLIGFFKGYILRLPILKSGLEILLFGGIAALIAFSISAWVKYAYGIF
ncbi:MAG TPA: VIT1/CCC1 transporter family protein [Gammaproteobacteria bacterium]|nr:VIT1/CCC1 transporter family protein [Gammaproteobacteria bacterium]